MFKGQSTKGFVRTSFASGIEAVESDMSPSVDFGTLSFSFNSHAPHRAVETASQIDPKQQQQFDANTAAVERSMAFQGDHKPTDSANPAQAASLQINAAQQGKDALASLPGRDASAAIAPAPSGGGGGAGTDLVNAVIGAALDTVVPFASLALTLLNNPLLAPAAPSMYLGSPSSRKEGGSSSGPSAFNAITAQITSLPGVAPVTSARAELTSSSVGDQDLKIKNLDPDTIHAHLTAMEKSASLIKDAALDHGRRQPSSPAMTA